MFIYSIINLDSIPLGRSPLVLFITRTGTGSYHVGMRSLIILLFQKEVFLSIFWSQDSRKLNGKSQGTEKIT